jgi:hypothetical protein
MFLAFFVQEIRQEKLCENCRHKIERKSARQKRQQETDNVSDIIKKICVTITMTLSKSENCMEVLYKTINVCFKDPCITYSRHVSLMLIT